MAAVIFGGRVPGRILGTGAVALALGVGEFLGVALAGVSPVAAVGDVAVDLAPGWLVRRTIGLLGTTQKPALLTGIACGALLAGAWSASDPWRARLVFGLAGLIGMLATLRAGSGPGGPLASIGGAGLGWLVLRDALGRMDGGRMDGGRMDGSRMGDRASVDRPGPDVIEDPKARVVGRRGFIGYAGGVAVAGGALAVGSRALADHASASYRNVALPSNRRVVGDRPTPTTTTEGPWRPPPGLSPWITPNDRFYRIDTALVVPRIDPDDWSLRIGGMVDRPLRITLDDLLSRDLVDAAVTLNCVSNEVGGHLVGNAVWTGVPLVELLEEADVAGGAAQVMGWSVDGFSAGFPTSVLDDARTALVAVGMNGEPLPFRHGFPARLVVAGLYGYVSAVKWLERIDLTTMDVDGYWIPKGWAKEAPIKIASRIDVPLRSQTIPGRQAVAGVAWAPVAGVAGVELAVDDGPWTACRLERGPGPGLDGEAWVQWSTAWDAEPGLRRLRVRAWDHDGVLQPPGPKHIAPDGAEGYHTRRVLVA